jgi:integrase
MKENGLQSNSMRFMHVLLSNMFKMALVQDKIRRNPMLAVDAPRKERREMKALDPSQVKTFLAAVEEEGLAVLFEFAFFTGLRPCEYLALKWSDVDWQARTFTVQRSIDWRAGGEWYLSEPKSKKARRTLPMTAKLTAKLGDHRSRQLEARLKAGSAWQANDFIFANEIGEPQKRKAVYDKFKRLLRAAKLPDFRLYDIRHTMATMLMAAGVSPKVVADRLGHSDVALTLNIYSHVSQGLQEQASDVVEKAFLA